MVENKQALPCVSQLFSEQLSAAREGAAAAVLPGQCGEVPVVPRSLIHMGFTAPALVLQEYDLSRASTTRLLQLPGLSVSLASQP